MRRIIGAIQQPALVEFACSLLRLPLLNSFAWQVFFGRGSFPDIDLNLAPERALLAYAKADPGDVTL
jgi:hypothetical protein